jgi:ATP-dependent Lon protease
MKIGLFPLNLVLFPESVYPLHIFEDRYKNLVNNCIENKSKFGIIFTNGNDIAEIGCTAKINDIFTKYPDGKIDLSVIGCDKFKLTSYEENENKYLEGEIEIISDIAEPIIEKLLDDCIELFNFITNKIPVFRVQQITKEDLIGRFASYYFAQKVGLIGKQKQFLLEMNSENQRLAYLKEHLERIKPSVSKAIEIEKIIRNDGYLAPGDLK